MKKDESTEARILAAAKKVFVARGMTGARMQDIADEAGINKALLHYYFKNKEKLFEMIFVEITMNFFPRMKMIFESDDPLFIKIENFCSAYIDNILSNPYIPIFVLNEIHQRPQWFVKKVLKAGPPQLTIFLRQVEESVKTGAIRPVHPMQLLLNILSMCIFPFVAKPMLMALTGIDEPAFRNIMELRKKEIPRFIIDSIKL